MTTFQVAHNSNKKPKYHLSDSFSTGLEITGLYIREDNGTSFNSVSLTKGSQAYPKNIKEFLG